MNRGIRYFLPEYFTLFLFGDGESKILKFPPAFSRSVENTVVHYVLIVVDILQKEEIPKKKLRHHYHHHLKKTTRESSENANLDLLIFNQSPICCWLSQVIGL